MLERDDEAETAGESGGVLVASSSPSPSASSISAGTGAHTFLSIGRLIIALARLLTLTVRFSSKTTTRDMALFSRW